MPTRNKGLLCYLPHRNLDVCNGSRLSHRAHGLSPCTARIETKELTGKSRGGGVCFYINNSWCDERNIHSIKSSAPLIWNFICSVSTILATEGIYSDHNHSLFIFPPQANTDQALKELYGNISEQETAHPDAALLLQETLIKPTSEQ